MRLLRAFIGCALVTLLAAASPPARATGDEAAKLPPMLEGVLPEPLPDGSRPRIPQRDLSRLLDAGQSIIDTLESLSFGITKKEYELEQVQEQREEVEARLGELEELFREEREALDKHQVRIRNRLRAIRHAGRMEGLLLLFAADDFTDYLRRERLLGRLLEQDRERLLEYRDAIARFRLSRTALQKKRDELARLETEIATTKAEIQQDLADHEELLRLVEVERAYYERYHHELRRRSRYIARRVEMLERWQGPAWFEAHRGRLTPPITPSRVRIPYGYRTHPRFKTRVLHRGLAIEPTRLPDEANPRAAVRAVYTGKVVYADWLSGYGRTVIIDHARGYYTLYARLALLNVEEGDVVATRDRIGFVGGPGQPRPGLYFELRHDGEPIDPSPWFR